MYADIAAVVLGVLDDHRRFFVTQKTALQLSSATGLFTRLRSTRLRSTTIDVRRPVHVDLLSMSAGRTLVSGCYNIHSIAYELDDSLEERHVLAINAFFLVETWHDADSFSFRRLRLDAFQVVDRPRLPGPD